MQDQPFLRGTPRGQSLPLEEYLPVFPASLVSSWLDKQPFHQGLLLMPFGSSPQIGVEAALSGFQVLAPVNNPVTRFLFRWLASPAPQRCLQSALAKLGSSYKGKERLEPHILSLYETNCPHCGKIISAQSFLWSNSTSAPIRKACSCECSQNTGDYPVTELDIEKTRSFQENSLYHARALTRVAPPGDPIRLHAEKALRVYSPRTVYALMTIINKIGALSLTRDERRCMDALLLHAFHRCSSLPSRTERGTNQPLRPPSRYLENNLWRALEEAVGQWSLTGTSLSVSTWPEHPVEKAGLCLYEGRLRDLRSEYQGDPLAAVVAAVPKPNPTYWALSALWAGWLWGQEAAAPLRSTLSLRDFDWAWYTRAMEFILSDLRELLSPQIRCWALLADLEEDFLSAALCAGNAAGLGLTGIALDPDYQIAQLEWRSKHTSRRDSPADSRSIIRQAGTSLLKERGEPSPGILLRAAGLRALAAENAFPFSGEDSLEDAFHQLETLLEETYAYRQGFLHFPASGNWWHQELVLDTEPLKDLVEIELVEMLLSKNSPVPMADFEDRINHFHPGLNTPGCEIIQLCLHSYAVPTGKDPAGWQLKPSEQPGKRREDLQEIEALLQGMGKAAGLVPRKQAPLGSVRILTWEEDAEVQFTFFISASGLLNRILFNYPTARNPWIVLPASRAELVLYKLDQNPPLAKVFEESWNFLKYRHVRRLAAEGSLTRSNLHERLALDPLTADDPQLPLI